MFAINIYLHNREYMFVTEEAEVGISIRYTMFRTSPVSFRFKFLYLHSESIEAEWRIYAPAN